MSGMNILVRYFNTLMQQAVNSSVQHGSALPQSEVTFLLKLFSQLIIKIRTRIIRESDIILHIISFSIHFFERQPSKHYQKKSYCRIIESSAS